MTYYADKEGNVYNANGLKLKYWINPSGYKYFKMYLEGGEKKAISLHRFTWEYFNGEIPTHLQIDHINEDKLDNRLENLQLSTNKSNVRRRSYCKLDMERAEQIRHKYNNTPISMDKLALEFNCSKTTIFNCLKNKTWA
jgi:hypothetical protein